jgi:hypothetical protein
VEGALDLLIERQPGLLGGAGEIPLQSSGLEASG